MKPTEKLKRLYAELPTIDCKGLCWESCGPIAMTGVEHRRMIREGGERYASGPKELCPYLEEHQCSVYPVRPLICRIWGLTEDMPCEWGCQPSRVMTAAEGHQFLRRATAISGGANDKRGTAVQHIDEATRRSYRMRWVPKPREAP